MGVNDLWPILSELCERQPLTFLSGKKVAIDLSGWVVEAYQCKGLNNVKNPHLRNLFFRVAHLLQLGVFPIFVSEGIPPKLKGFTVKQRCGDRFSVKKHISRFLFDRTLKQCEDLLSTLGVPCVRSSGEAEALCALLCLKGVVSGVITEDNDAFLYGADVVYRDFTSDAQNSHVKVYCLKSPKNKNKLDRRKLVALALLLGCDYCQGLPGVGKEKAIKLLNEMKCDDILQRFKDWKNLDEQELFPGKVRRKLHYIKASHCRRCGHLGLSSEHKKSGCLTCSSAIMCNLPDVNNPCLCNWHKNDDVQNRCKTELKIYETAINCPNFPELEVINEYLNFPDTIPSDEVLEWVSPNMADFQSKAEKYLNWTYEYSSKKFSPIITSWQQYKLLTSDCDRTNFVYEPIEILQERSIKDVAHFEVQWKLLNGGDSDMLITTEFADRFSVSYKKLADDFYRELREQKQEREKAKKRKMAAKGNRKIDEFFIKKVRLRSEVQSNSNGDTDNSISLLSSDCSTNSLEPGSNSNAKTSSFELAANISSDCEIISEFDPPSPERIYITLL